MFVIITFCLKRELIIITSIYGYLDLQISIKLIVNRWVVSPHISSFSKEIAEQDNSYNYTLNITERKTVGDNSCKKICASLNLNDKTGIARVGNEKGYLSLSLTKKKWKKI